jgi:hypothetical protein
MRAVPVPLDNAGAYFPRPVFLQHSNGYRYPAFLDPDLTMARIGLAMAGSRVTEPLTWSIGPIGFLEQGIEHNAEILQRMALLELATGPGVGSPIISGCEIFQKPGRCGCGAVNTR